MNPFPARHEPNETRMGGIASVRAQSSAATPAETDPPRPNAAPPAAAEADRREPCLLPSPPGRRLRWTAGMKGAPVVLLRVQCEITESTRLSRGRPVPSCRRTTATRTLFTARRQLVDAGRSLFSGGPLGRPGGRHDVAGVDRAPPAAAISRRSVSGFMHTTNEFATPYQMIDWHACKSRWHDVRLRFDFWGCPWRPRHAGTPRQFECPRLMTAAQVIATPRCKPGFIEWGFIERGLIERAGHGRPATMPATGDSGGIGS
jgi:hypothetical protein